jgi:Fe-S cluster assembly protein SufD
MTALEQINNSITRQLKYPSKKNEEYKYCDIDKLYTPDYGLDSGLEQINDKVKKLVSEVKSSVDEKSNILIYLNGKFQRELSTIVMTNGLSIHNLNKDSDNILFQNYFDKCVDQNEILVSNNAKLIEEVLFINIAKQTEIETPVIIVYINSGLNKTIYHTRTLIVAERHSKFNFVELFIGDNETSKFQNNVTEIAIEDNAKVNHVKVQNASDTDILLNTTQALQRKCSKYKSFVISLQGQLIRNNTSAILDAELIETFMYGLYIVNKKQIIDNHTLVDHRKPNCYSNELYKGVIDEKGTAIFNGKVFVRQDAQKTNAYQSNRNILLSDNATINTKPQLEIFADDVKCSHGASTGKIDEEAIFYLRSRGISANTAKRMMLEAFVAEVSEVLPTWALKDFTVKLINNKLN